MIASNAVPGTGNAHVPRSTTASSRASSAHCACASGGPTATGRCSPSASARSAAASGSTCISVRRTVRTTVLPSAPVVVVVCTSECCSVTRPGTAATFLRRMILITCV